MNNHYLIEVTQVQKFFVSIDAETPNNAIKQALAQNSDMIEAMPPEVTEITAKVLGGD